MGFRFRKSIKILPGVKINLGKKGASVSIGGRGATVNLNKNGIRRTIGIPGSGISYSTYTPYKRGQCTPQKEYGKSDYIAIIVISLFMIGIGFLIDKKIIWIPFFILGALGFIALLGAESSESKITK